MQLSTVLDINFDENQSLKHVLLLPFWASIACFRQSFLGHKSRNQLQLFEYGTELETLADKYVCIHITLYFTPY